jgi:hypothetical protein
MLTFQEQIELLETKLVHIEQRVHSDLITYFGEIDYEKVIEASGAYNSDYLNSDDKVNCALSLTSFVAAVIKANEGDIAGAYNAINHVTHFWTLLFSSEQQREKVSGKNKANADKGHESNKATKEAAIQYYKDNFKLFKNKNDAAEELSKKFSRSFATTRDWLRNIKPV